MTLNIEDRLDILEVLALHGHLVDAGELDRMGEVFAEDATFDLTDFDAGIVTGLERLRAAALALGDGNPVGHHVTNTVLTAALDDGRVRALSKGIGINAGATCGSVTYEDTVVRGSAGWRIAYRRIVARRRPLGR